MRFLLKTERSGPRYRRQWWLLGAAHGGRPTRSFWSAGGWPPDVLGRDAARGL